MRTSMTPVDGSASCEKVCPDRSMMRPGTVGPRSSTVQVVERPLDRSVTLTAVPKAMCRLAQVPALAQYHEAPPVSSSAGAAGGGGAVVAVVVGSGGTVVGGGGTYITATAGGAARVVLVVVVASATRSA